MMSLQDLIKFSSTYLLQHTLHNVASTFFFIFPIFPYYSLLIAYIIHLLFYNTSKLFILAIYIYNLNYKPL